MTTLYTMLYTAYVTAVACFALWATHRVKVHRYEDVGWEVTTSESQE